MTVVLSPLGGAAAQFFDSNGSPLSGGFIYTYAAGTTTPQATYTTSAGNIAHSNPIVLDAAGRVPTGEIWLTESQKYKFVIQTSASVLVGTYDNITGINDFSSLVPIVYNGVGTGAQTNFVLASAPLNENTTNVFISGCYQQKNTYSLTSATIVFSEAPPSAATIEINYY